MRFLAVLGAWAVVAGNALAPAALASPGALHDALNLPQWITLGVQSRLRYESVDGQFRANGRGGDQIFVTQTLAQLEAGSQTARVGFEMLDARAMLDDAGTPIDTTQVNPADLLQAYALLRAARTGPLDAASEFRLGRQTVDFGSRRLVARNRFRNTINAFTGLDWKLTAQAGWSTEAFVGSPVLRKPDDRRRLAADEAEFDEEDFGTLIGLLGWKSAPLVTAPLRQARIEIYVIGLDESDRPDSPRNRDLLTPGLRLFRDPAPATVDYQFETMLQVGTSRAIDRPTARRDLDHLAHYQAAHIGYTFLAPWSPRVSAMFDYASGDDDPRDGDNGRFDTLFGARRFDYGPTGIWGAFQRSNIVSPGARLNFAPAAGVRGMVGHRAFWLASAKDQWVPTRVEDRTGRSGSFVGHQLEFSLGWASAPGHVDIEIGGAFLDGGEFPADAPNAGRDGENSSYLYSQVTFRF